MIVIPFKFQFNKKKRKKKVRSSINTIVKTTTIINSRPVKEASFEIISKEVKRERRKKKGGMRKREER